MEKHRRSLTEVLETVPLLARRLRGSAASQTQAGNAPMERVQTDLSLALRCVDLVLALDDAMQAEQSRRSVAAEMPLAVLDLGRLTAQGLFDAGAASGQLWRSDLAPLNYQLRRSPGSGYILSVWSGAQRNDLPIVATHPRFGGDRYWFVCPAHERPGDQRALHLYLDAESGLFSCRACCHVASRWPANRLREQRALDLRRLPPATVAPGVSTIMSA